MKQAKLSVGEVSKRCGVNISTLHFYEQKGLIRSWRNAGNQRRYKSDVLRRISVIKAAQKMGLSLSEIKTAFRHLPGERTPTKKDWEKLSRKWRVNLDQRIQCLQKLRDDLTGCIGCGCLSLRSCPIYNANDHLSQEGTGAILLEKVLSTNE